MNKNKKKRLFFNKKIVIITAAVMMMGQVCFMPQITQNRVMAKPLSQFDSKKFKEVYIKPLVQDTNQVDAILLPMYEILNTMQPDDKREIISKIKDENNEEAYGINPDSNLYFLANAVGDERAKEIGQKRGVKDPFLYLSNFIKLKTNADIIFMNGNYDKKTTTELGRINNFDLMSAINYVVNNNEKKIEDSLGYKIYANLKDLINTVKEMYGTLLSSDVPDAAKDEMVKFCQVRVSEMAMQLACRLTVVKRIAEANAAISGGGRACLSFAHGVQQIPFLNDDGLKSEFDKVINNMHAIFYDYMAGFCEDLLEQAVLPFVMIRQADGKYVETADEICDEIENMLDFEGIGIDSKTIEQIQQSKGKTDEIKEIIGTNRPNKIINDELIKNPMYSFLIGAENRALKVTGGNTEKVLRFDTGGPGNPNYAPVRDTLSNESMQYYFKQEIIGSGDQGLIELQKNIFKILKEACQKAVGPNAVDEVKNALGELTSYMGIIMEPILFQKIMLFRILEMVDLDKAGLKNLSNNANSIIINLSKDEVQRYFTEYSSMMTRLQRIVSICTEFIGGRMAVQITTTDPNIGNYATADFGGHANGQPDHLVRTNDSHIEGMASTIAMLLKNHVVFSGNIFAAGSNRNDMATLTTDMAKYLDFVKKYNRERFDITSNINFPDQNLPLIGNAVQGFIKIMLSSEIFKEQKIDYSKLKASSSKINSIVDGWDSKGKQMMYQLCFLPEGQNGKIRLGGTYIKGILNDNQVKYLLNNYSDSVKFYKMYVEQMQIQRDLYDFNEDLSLARELPPDNNRNSRNRIRNINENTLNNLLNNIVEMAEGMKLYYLNGNGGSGRRLAINLIFSFYKMIAELEDNAFEENPIGKDQFMEIIINKIFALIGHNNMSDQMKAEVIAMLQRTVEKKLKYEDVVKFCKAFIFIDEEEESKIINSLTDNIGTESFTSIVKRIVNSNSPEVKRIIKEGFKKLIKAMVNENDKTTTGVSGFYLTPVLEDITSSIMYERNKLYDKAYEGFSKLVGDSKSIDNIYKKIFSDVVESEGRPSKIDVISSIKEMSSFARTTSEYYKGIKDRCEQGKDHYNYRSLNFGSGYGLSFGMQNVEVTFFNAAEQMWKNFADDLDEYNKMVNEKDKVKESDVLGKKLRDVLYRHVEQMMSLFGMFVRIWQEEKNEWKNFIELTGSDKNENNDSAPHVLIRKAINKLMRELSTSLNCGNIEDVNAIINMVGDDGGIGNFYYGSGSSATRTMRDSMKNIKIILQDLSKNKTNADFVRQTTASVQKMLLYEIIQFLFCKTFFAKEYTIRNFNFETGKEIKDETELNKDIELIFDKEQIPATNFKEFMFKLLQKMVEDNIYKGLYEVTIARYGLSDAQNRSKQLKYQINKFMENANPVYEELMKYYNGENLTETDKTDDKGDSKETEKENEAEVKEDKEKVKEEPKEKKVAEVENVIMDSEGWIYVKPFKDKNQEASEGTIRYRINFKERKVEIEAFGFNLPSTNFRIVIKTILNGKVIDQPTVMTKNGDKYTAVVNLPEDPKNRVGMHFYIKEDNDTTPVSQVEGKNFICGVDLLNLADLKSMVEQVIKTTKTTKGEFHNGDKSLLQNPPTMTLYKIGNKILVMMEGVEGSDLVATVLASGNATIKDGENRSTLSRMESKPNLWFFVIEDNIASQIGEKFSIHFHYRKQAEDTFKYYAEVDFNKAAPEEVNKKDDEDKEKEKESVETPKAKKNKLQVENEEDAEDNSGEETDVEDEEDDDEKGNKKLKTNKKNGKKNKKGKKNKDDDEDDENNEGDEKDEKDYAKSKGLVDLDDNSRNNDGLDTPFFFYTPNF